MHKRLLATALLAFASSVFAQMIEVDRKRYTQIIRERKISVD